MKEIHFYFFFHFFPSIPFQKLLYPTSKINFTKKKKNAITIITTAMMERAI
jgi:hypothetical protein